MKSVALISALLLTTFFGFTQKTFTTTEHVRFSADGKQVIFSSAVYEASTTSGVSAERISARIALMNTDGSNLKFITTIVPGFADASPVLSSDGKKILFRRDKISVGAEPGDIYIINVDGTGLKQLSAKMEHETNPEFTTDGKGVIYVREYFVGPGKPSNGELIYVDISGSNEKVLVAKEMRVVQAVPLTIGRGGYLLACAQTTDENKILPTGSMLVLISPDGEISPKGKMIFSQKENVRIKNIRVVQKDQLTIYVHGSEGDGWFAGDVNYKVSSGQVKKLPDGTAYYYDVSLSPDGKNGASGDTGVARINFWDFTNDQFGNKRIVLGK